MTSQFVPTVTDMVTIVSNIIDGYGMGPIRALHRSQSKTPKTPPAAGLMCNTGYIDIGLAAMQMYLCSLLPTQTPLDSVDLFYLSMILRNAATS